MKTTWPRFCLSSLGYLTPADNWRAKLAASALSAWSVESAPVFQVHTALLTFLEVILVPLDQTANNYGSKPVNKSWKLPHFWNTLDVSFHRAPDIALLNHWSWPFEPFHWIFVWFHIVCDRYTLDNAHFTYFNTIWPLSLSSNFGTAFITRPHILSYHYGKYSGAGTNPSSLHLGSGEQDLCLSHGNLTRHHHHHPPHHHHHTPPPYHHCSPHHHHWTMNTICRCSSWPTWLRLSWSALEPLRLNFSYLIIVIIVNMS